MRVVTKMKVGLALLAAAMVAASAAPAFAQESGTGTGTGTKPPPRKWREIGMPPLRQFAPPKPERHVLPNGLVLYMLEDHELPMIDMVALVRAGSVYEPREKAGLAGICGEVMRTGGTKSKTGDELDRVLEDIAASVEVGVSTWEARASASCLKENFDQVLPVLMDVLDRPEFRQDKVDLSKKQAKSGIARRNDEPSGIARREYGRLMYGDDSPYGWTAELATIDAISRDDLVAFHKRFFGFGDRTIVGVVGDFDAKAMRAASEKAFAGWGKAGEKLPEPPAVGEGAAPKTYFARKTDVNQATILIGHMGLQRRADDPDHAATIVVNDVLGGGGFASRLLQRVRTEMGLAYGVGSSFNAPYSHKGTFTLQCQTKSESTVQAIKAILKEVELVVSQPVTADELRVAKESIQQQLIFESETRAEVIARALRYEYYGFPQDYLETFQASIAKVTAEDCLRVAKARFKPERFAVLVVGNDKEFDAALSTLGRGDPVELDYQKPAWPKGGAAGAGAGAGAAAAAPASPEAIAKGRAVIEAALKARGGREALEAVKSVKVKGKGMRITPMGPVPVQVVQLLAFPDRVRIDMMMGPMMVTYGSDGKKAWVKAPQGVMDLSESEGRDIRDQVAKDEIRMLLALAAVDAKPAHLGAEGEMDVIDAGEGVKLYFDKEGRLVQRTEKNPAGETARSTWSDFRAVAGVQFPFAGKSFTDANETGNFTFDSIEVNVEVPADAFEKPAGNEMQPGRRSRPPKEREKEPAGAGAGSQG